MEGLDRANAEGRGLLWRFGMCGLAVTDECCANLILVSHSSVVCRLLDRLIPRRIVSHGGVGIRSVDLCGTKAKESRSSQIVCEGCSISIHEDVE